MLHESIKAAVEQRLAVAQAATPGPWRLIWRNQDLALLGRDHANADVMSSVAEWAYGIRPWVQADIDDCDIDDATFIAANDPDRIIRDCQRDLKVLARHAPMSPVGRYVGCADCYDDSGSRSWPCDEIRDLAEAYDIPTGDSP